MMHTTYSTSIFSLTTFHDYSNERCPYYCSSCYCSIPINSCQLFIPTNPRFLYGLRQSTLIQCPPSRRFLSGSGNRYCSRSPVYDVGRCRFFDSCCVKQERVETVGRGSCESKFSGTRDCSRSPVYDVGRCRFFDSCCVEQERGERVGRNSCESKCSGTRYCSRSSVYDVGRCRVFDSCCVEQERVERVGRNSCESKCCIKEKKKGVGNVKGRMARPRRNLRVYDVGDAEAMLSLLSEDIVEECVVLKEKTKGFREGGKVVSKRNVVIEEIMDGNEHVSRHIEGKPRNEEIESRRVPSRDEGYKRREERYDTSKREDQRLKGRESGSSYYSVSDSGDFGSDIEVEIEQDQFVGESSMSYNKNEGVVVSEEARQGSEKFGDDYDQELRSSRRDDRVVGSSIQQNWRKKSEKKLAEESEESNYRSDSASRQSQLSKIKESSAMIASLKKNINFREEQSTSDVKSHAQSSALIQKDNRVNEYLKSNIQRTRERENIGTTSTSWRSSRQEDSERVDNSVLETGCEYCKTCGRSMEEKKTQLDFQQLTEQSKMNLDASLSENQYRRQEKGSSSQQISVLEESNLHGQMHIMAGQASAKQTSQHHLETISSTNACAQSTVMEQQLDTRVQSVAESSRINAESQSESRRGMEEKSTSSIQTSVKEEKRQDDQIYLETAHVDASRKSQRRKETMEDDGSLRRSNLRLQRQSETRMKHLEEKTTSVSVAEELKRLRDESSKVSHTEIGHSRVHSSDLEINSQSISDKRVYNEQTYSKTKVQSLEELVEKRKRIEETIVQSMIRTEAQEPSAGHLSSEATVSQSSAPSISRIGAHELSGEETKSEQLSVTSPAYQYESQSLKASGSGMKNDAQKIKEVGSSSTLMLPQARSSSSYDEVDDTERKSSEEYSPENVLASAARMQESSTHIIGQFVEQMSHEASTSELKSSSEKFSKLEHPDEKHLLKSSSQPEINTTGLQNQGSELSSRVSTLDSENQRSQIHDSKHSLTKESSEGATSETVAAVRTGKFLWNIVANICRFRWGPHSENEKSPVKKRSSPTGSSGGETWFSGDEVDEGNGNGAKAEKVRLLQESSSGQSPLQTTITQKEDVVVSLDDKLSHVDEGALSSSSTLQSSSLSGGDIFGGSTNLDIPQLIPLPGSSLGLSVRSAKHLRRSLAFEEHDEEEKNETPVSFSEERRDSMHEERQSDVSPSEGTDVSPSEGESKTDSKRRLQRSKLVLQRYDEWEDAYRREREQKKVDEIFMREALSEAIKAADSWEVPVGAVLVQNGKIIARGYNLVEELRDSTAHAEMICIREASNVLHTWRLSETTLYVTLEPCPMCAGAILQARINTLVWGAPNKLLGADGSWIRLFPEGLEGDERSEVADKPAAPVHPFHPKMNIRRGILQEECADIMQQFFQLKRRKAKPKPTPSEEPPQPTCFPRPKHKSKLLHKMHNVFHPSNPPVD